MRIDGSLLGHLFELVHEKHALDNRLLTPKRAVVVKRCDTMLGGDEVRASFCGYVGNEMNDCLFSLTFISGR